MEEIRRAAGAYYENLPDEEKRNARFSFNEMDKNKDGKINLDEYVEYLKKDNNTVLPSLFTALDKDGNGTLDFDEAIVLYYIMQSGSAIICQSCKTFLAGAYFTCSQCFFNDDDSVSTFDVCLIVMVVKSSDTTMGTSSAITILYYVKAGARYKRPP
jgi:hypothetical protein